MKRGQTEPSFQWLFVLIAGGVLFLLFGVLIKSCAQSGSSTAEGLELSVVQQKISSDAWQGESLAEVMLPSAEVVCPEQGSMTFIGLTQQASVDDAPVFVSSGIGGSATMKSVPLFLQENDVPIPFGSIVYVFDHQTAYLFIQDRENKVAEIASSVLSPRKKIIDASRLPYLSTEIPEGSLRVVVVAVQDGLLGNVDLTGVSEDVDISALVLLPTFVNGGSIRFFSRSGNAFRESSRGQYASGEMALGAVVSGKSTLYSCGERAIAKRARLLSNVYSSRSENLSRSSLESPCVEYLHEASTILAQASEKNDDAEFLNALFSSAQRLTALQGALRAASCPVIA